LLERFFFVLLDEEEEDEDEEESWDVERDEGLELAEVGAWATWACEMDVVMMGAMTAKPGWFLGFAAGSIGRGSAVVCCCCWIGGGLRA
jgi:hypothetical protein